MKILFLMFFTLFFISCSNEVDLNRFTTDPESEDIFEFEAFNLQEAEQTCDSKIPVKNRHQTERGIEASCDYNTKTYSCKCVIKRLATNQSPDEEEILYLKKKDSKKKPEEEKK